jgi:poly(3-hydroxybutyrate) depolymerase
VVAFPQGSISSRAGWEWDLQGDIAFLDAAVDYLRETFGVTAVALCVSGMSGGARMASRFSSSGRNLVRVLGAVAGLRMPTVERLDHPVRDDPGAVTLCGSATGRGTRGRGRASRSGSGCSWARCPTTWTPRPRYGGRSAGGLATIDGWCQAEPGERAHDA